ncbi:uncharacterized protein LOC135500793 [Lineus longissimus]|uniref:uncharacterized protein LOC135500793 n=1 Tax=Lineus longissimus TaxID=88925 RepID=UPI002B4E9797
MRTLYVLLVLVVVSVLVVDAKRRKTGKHSDGRLRKMWRTCVSLKAKANSTTTLTKKEEHTLSSKICRKVLKKWKIRKHKMTACKAIRAKPKTTRTEEEDKMAESVLCKKFAKHGKKTHSSGKRKHGKGEKKGHVTKMLKPCLALKAKNDNETVTLTKKESKTLNSKVCKRIFTWLAKAAKCKAIIDKAKENLTKEDKTLSKKTWCKRKLEMIREKRAKGRHHKKNDRSVASGGKVENVNKVKNPKRSNSRHGAKKGRRTSSYWSRRRQGIAKCREILRAKGKGRKTKIKAHQECVRKVMRKINLEDNNRCQPITKVYNSSSPIKYEGYAAGSVKPTNDSEGCSAKCERRSIHGCRSAVFIEGANMCVLLTKLPTTALNRVPSNTTGLLRPCEACTTSIRFCNGTAPAQPRRKQMKLNSKRGKRRSNRLNLRKKHRRGRKGQKRTDDGKTKKRL